MSPVGKKQTTSNEDFVRARQNIQALVSREHIEALVDEAAAQVAEQARGKRAGYGWSGGKDSQALRAVMERAGVEPCLLALTAGLEYEAFERFVEWNRPDGLRIIRTPQDLDWLADHQEMLFPRVGRITAHWYRLVQHVAQDAFYREQELDVLFLGRRRQDGTYTGRDGSGVYTTRRGVTRSAPIRDWTHEEVMACCHYLGYAMAPIYEWPNGFVVGTGPWPARTFTTSDEQAWAEVYTIDPAVVQGAAERLPSARSYLEGRCAG